MREKNIKHENGKYWVCDTGQSYAVMVIGITHSKSESEYPHDKDGLSLAIARCNYLAKRFKDGLNF